MVPKLHFEVKTICPHVGVYMQIYKYIYIHTDRPVLSRNAILMLIGVITHENEQIKKKNFEFGQFLKILAILLICHIPPTFRHFFRPSVCTSSASRFIIVKEHSFLSWYPFTYTFTTALDCSCGRISRAALVRDRVS